MTNYVYTKRYTSYGTSYFQHRIAHETAQFITDEIGRKFNKRTCKEVGEIYRPLYLITEQEYIEGLKQNKIDAIKSVERDLEIKRIEFQKVEQEYLQRINALKAKLEE